VTSSESSAISIDAHVNRQGFRNPKIKLKVDGKEDELEHREWSEAKVTLRHRRKGNQRFYRRGERSVHPLSATKNGAWFAREPTLYQSAVLALPSWRRRQRVRWTGAYFRAYLRPNHQMENCWSNDQCRHCHGEHNSLLHLEATGGRKKADQRAGSDEAVVPSEEAASFRKDGLDNVINIDGWITYIPGTPKTVQLASSRVKQIPKLEEELISARALLSSMSDALFVTERTLLQSVL